jgi:DNA-binding beta-propeller fold protein YncE
MLGIVGLYDAGGVLLVRTVPVGASPILAAVDEQTGRTFVVDWSGPATRASVSVLDTATGTLLRSVPIGVNPRAVAVDRRAGRVFVLNYGADPVPGRGSISVLDALTGQVLRTDTIGAFPPLQGGVIMDEVSGRAFAISSAAHRGLVTVIDSRSGRVTRRVRVAGEPTALGVDLSAGHVFVGWVAADETARVSMLDAASGHILHTIAVDAYPRTMAADARTGRMVLVTASGVSVLGSCATRRRVIAFPLPRTTTFCCMPHPTASRRELTPGCPPTFLNEPYEPKVTQKAQDVMPLSPRTVNMVGTGRGPSTCREDLVPRGSQGCSPASACGQRPIARPRPSSSGGP